MYYIASYPGPTPSFWSLAVRNAKKAWEPGNEATVITFLVSSGNNGHAAICTYICSDECTVFPRSVAAATINFSFTEVRRLFEGGVYSRAAFILPAGLPPFPATPTALM